jgi:hypothetical protein
MVKQNLINMVKHRVEGCPNIRLDKDFQVAVIKLIISNCDVQYQRTQGLAQGSVNKKKQEKRKASRALEKKTKRGGGPSRKVSELNSTVKEIP